MRPLPNGVMPYNGIMDCITKILKYESSMERSSTVGAFYSGLEAYWIRLFLVCYLSMFILDYYHANNYQTEFWQPARFHYQSGIDYDIHNPYTDSFNKQLVASYVGKGGFPAANPTGKDGMVII
jgi:hypothetical protein